ncbi:MAG: histidine kinase dimerization/phospho-acceptor domain-containing protein [Variovorax sp.]
MRSNTAAIGIAGACIGLAAVLLAARKVREDTERELAVMRGARALHAGRADRLGHDLRTPIGTIAAALEFLPGAGAGAGDAALQAEARRVIGRQLSRMTALTESLREFAQELGR